MRRSSLGVRKYTLSLLPFLRIHAEVCLVTSSTSTHRLIGKLQDFFYIPPNDGIYWCPTLSCSLIAQNQIVTIHDLISYEHRIQNRLIRLFYLLYARLSIARATKVVAISNETKNKIRKYYKVRQDKLITIKSPIRITDWPTSPTCLLPPVQRYFLAITNDLNHKNNGLALEALNDLAGARSFELIVVGKLSHSDLDFLNNSDIKYRILSRVSDELLCSLISNTSLLISTSLQEGHNLPLAEAISLGVNIACSDIPVHREFYDGYAHFFSLDDKSELISICCKALRLELIPPLLNQDERTFANVATDYIRVFKQCLLSQ